MPDSDSLGYWIRRRRKALDLTQAELADQIPCSLATIKKIETDARRPSPQMAERLAICLSLPAREQALFLAVAQGKRPVSFLALSETPEVAQPPLDKLPHVGTPFFGREAELAAIAALLASPDVRLLTILGPGGMGKTRLALAAADGERDMQPRQFIDGVAFVDLASVHENDAVLLAIAATLGLDLAERRGDNRSSLQKLLDFLAPRRLLLILDNFEQLVSAGSARLLADMLAAAPGLKLLVTSRLRLSLREEHLYPLSGIEVAPLKPDNQPSAASRLFVTSARRLRPDFGLLSEDEPILDRICRQVEGMPLALELAAAWVDSLSLAGIADELGAGVDLLASDLVDLPARHRSIEAVLDGTWRLLKPDEQRAFMQLCVFRGGFSRAAAAEVASARLPTLARLISMSLLTFDPAGERYRVHEVLRQHGHEKLAQEGTRVATERRHFDYFLRMAQTATDHLFGPEQIAWLDRLDAEGDNVRVALAWSFAQPELAGGAADLVIALSWFWRIRSHVMEGRQWLDRSLQLPGLTTAQRAALLYHAGHMAWMQDDLALSMQREEESLAFWRSLGDSGRRGAAYALHTLGMARYSAAYFSDNADVPPALESLEASLALMRAVADEWGIAFVAGWIARCRVVQGEASQAIMLGVLENVAIHRRLGDVWGTGMAMGMLASLSLQAGDLSAAREYAEQAQSLRAQVGHRHSLAVGWDLLATIAERENNLNAAVAACREAIILLEGLGNRPYADEMRAKLAALMSKQAARNAEDLVRLANREGVPAGSQN